jgi:transcriptional regulator
MYVPQHFAATEAEAAALLDAAHAADLISIGPDGMVATFLPVLHAGGALLGHVARANRHWRLDGAQSLAIVRGPDAYISPNWYPAKAEHGKVVPTWNYVVAHVHGTLAVHDDREWLRALVTSLTEREEAAMPEPWAVTDAPADYIDTMLKAIVGVELRIERVEATRKLSQNRSLADIAGVFAGLGHHPLAGEMGS